MARRGENICKRKDGRWEARLIEHDCNGVKYRYFYGKTYAEAKSKRSKEQFRKQSDHEAGSKSQILLDWLAMSWLAAIRACVKESTFARYHRCVHQYILPELGEVSLLRLAPTLVNQFTIRLLEEGRRNGNGGLGGKTVSDILSVLKLIFKFGIENGYPCPNPAAIRQPRQQKPDIQILSADKQSKLESLLWHSEDPTNLGVLLTLYTGVRNGELCALQWGDFDFSEHTVKISRTIGRVTDLRPEAKTKTKIVIHEPKTENSLRRIPLPGFLSQYLQRCQKEDSIFLVTGTAQPTEPHCFYVRYHRLMKGLGLTGYTFHALRHTFATRCVELGFDVKSLSEILGHANITTTLRCYVHPTLQQKRVQMERLLPMGKPADLCEE